MLVVGFRGLLVDLRCPSLPGGLFPGFALRGCVEGANLPNSGMVLARPADAASATAGARPAGGHCREAGRASRVESGQALARSDLSSLRVWTAKGYEL